MRDVNLAEISAYIAGLSGRYGSVKVCSTCVSHAYVLKIFTDLRERRFSS